MIDSDRLQDKGYGYDSHPLDVCMKKKTKESNIGGSGLVMNSSPALIPLIIMPLIGVCAYCTLLNVNGLTSCYLSEFVQILLL